MPILFLLMLLGKGLQSSDTKGVAVALGFDPPAESGYKGLVMQTFAQPTNLSSKRVVSEQLGKITSAFLDLMSNVDRQGNASSRESLKKVLLSFYSSRACLAQAAEGDARFWHSWEK